MKQRSMMAATLGLLASTLSMGALSTASRTEEDRDELLQAQGMPLVEDKPKKQRSSSKPKRVHQKISSCYIPAGPDMNVAGTFVRNDKQAEQMRRTHESWYLKKFGGQSVS